MREPFMQLLRLINGKKYQRRDRCIFMANLKTLKKAAVFSAVLIAVLCGTMIVMRAFPTEENSQDSIDAFPEKTPYKNEWEISSTGENGSSFKDIREERVKVEFDTKVKNDDNTIIIKPSQIIKASPELIEQIGQQEGAKDPITGLFDTTLDIVQENDSAKFDFSLHNISEEDLKFYFSSGQKFDIFVSDHNGEEVYRWSHDKDFIMAIIPIELKKGEKLSFAQTWDYTDNDGSRVPPSKYTVTVKILAKFENGKKTSPDELTAVKEMEIPGLKKEINENNAI